MADELNNQNLEQQEGEAEKNARLAFEQLAKDDKAEPVNTDGSTATTETKAESSATVEVKPQTDTKQSTEQAKTGEGDDDLKDLPEDKPTPDHWKTLRERHKAMKAEMRELKKAREQVKPVETETVITEPLAQTVTPPPTPAKDSKGQDRIAPEKVFNVLARVASGELDESYQKEAETYITDELSPQEIADVYRKAQSGYFGEGSQAVKDACAKYLPIAQQNFALRERQAAGMREAQNLRANAWKQVFTAIPKLQDRESVEFKTFGEANKALTEQFPDLWNRPEAPILLMRYAEMHGKATKTADIEKRLAALEAENADLKKKMQSRNAPIDTSGGNTPTKQSAEDTLRNGLRDAGISAQ